jgi:FAD/FMN-containing dehydrogenase
VNDLSVPSDLPQRLKAIVGERGLVDAAEHGAFENDWRGRFRGRAAAVVRPANTEETSRVVALLHQLRLPIVPQAGNTSLCGGATPDDSGREVIINVSRMNRVREVDVHDNTMTVEAGCILQTLQEVAEKHDRLFPLSLGAQGSCEIGGNLSTNAGGTGVLRYGNTRDLVLGLEVVLPDGQVWNGLRRLRKDNTGYDLKHLFVGAEGTLGIVTAAVLKLFPLPRSYATAFIAVESPQAAVALLSFLRMRCGERITGFELMSRVCMDIVLSQIPGARDPLPQPHGWYVLVELSDSTEGPTLDELLENALGEAAEQGAILDAALAANRQQRIDFWKLREDMAEAQKLEGEPIKHDISVPVSRVPDFIAQASAALAKRYPGIRIIAFGHVGDGNVHYNCTMGVGDESRKFLFAEHEPVNDIVYDVVHALDGSISAEHGLGQLKRDEIKRYKDPLELELMRSVKKTLDPMGLMNPGKVL